jgi:hypothetical protein
VPANLKSGIESLRSDAGAAAELAVKVGGTALDAKVARQCQAGIGEILGIVKQAIQKTTEIIAAFEPLQASFVDCTGKATTLAGDVRHAGLNAQVFAIRTSDGATLEVLAERVHAISEEVIQQVEGMGAALNHTSEMVNNLRQRLEDFEVLCQMEQEVLAEESALSQKKLAELESAIPVQIQGVTQRQRAFALSVEEVLANIKFPATVAKAGSRSIGFFQELVAWGSEGGSEPAGDSAAAQKIDLLKSKYTMDSERHAHVAALQPVTEPAKAEDAQASIELFDDFASTAPAATVSLGEAMLFGERREDQPRPTKLADAKASPPAPVISVAESTPAASGDLGGNVELF